MTTIRTIAVFACVVLCAALYSNTQPTAAVPAALANPFQLVPAQTSHGGPGAASWEEHTVFLIDTRSGQVWEYWASMTTSDGKVHEAALVPVKTALP